MLVVGIEVGPELVDRWLGWFSPAVQPFVLAKEMAATFGLVDERDRLGFEHRDTFLLYDIADDGALVWLDEDAASTLPRSVHRAQPAAHHWPTGDRERQVARVIDFIEDGVRASRHLEVARGVWQASERVLPYARSLAGRFPDRSGPNCFATVMAAAGVPGAAQQWMLREPFEAWLAESAEPGGRDSDPGTLLVWRGPDREVQHAAVTLGAGWALHKPSQGWMSPTKVLSVAEAKASARAKGRRLHRYRLRTVQVSAQRRPYS